MALPYSNQDVSAVLYQNAEKTVTLLDIPTSVSLAQGTAEHPCTNRIYSLHPPQAPYPSIEPKSENARANVLQTKRDPDVDFPEVLLHQALVGIAEYANGDWCLQRKISPLAVQRRSKRRKLESSISPALSSWSRDPNQQLGSLPLAGSTKTLENLDGFSSRMEPAIRIPEDLLQSRTLNEPLVLRTDSNSRTTTCHHHIHEIANRVVCNLNATSTTLQFPTSRYILPPRANFLLSRISHATAPAISMAALTVLPDPSNTAGPGQFDFVLLDPPWDNRSVKRSAKYKTMSDSDPMEALRGMLGRHIAPGGLVTCWVTNKASTRDAAMEAFDCWGVQLIEVWAWLKITVQGVPVTEIEGVWRKPYELLLVGRRTDSEIESSDDRVQTRVIAAVPDLHSRKPSLKELIEPLLPAQYRALEVFARNLTAGWWAWGDEVLKYNWEGHWLHV